MTSSEAVSNGASVSLSALNRLVATIEKTTTGLDTSLRAFERDMASSSTSQDFAYADGISLFSVKNDALLDYLHHLVALCVWKISGRSLKSGADQRAGQLVTNLVKLRLMLEKTRPLENRLKYQTDKLLRAAADNDKEIMSGRVKAARNASTVVGNDEGGAKDGSEDDRDAEDDDEDDLAFRPNPSAFMQDKARAGANTTDNGKKKRSSKAKGDSDDSDSESDAGKTAKYRPPKLVPMAYDPDARSSRKDARNAGKGGITRNSALLSDLTAGMSSNPYEASSGGVGVGGRLAAQNSARAKALQRMEEFEEENFTRLVMSKKDAKKRRRDEADIALGGAGLSSGRDGRRRIGGGMEEEFGDLLRGSGLDGRKGKKAKRAQDAYDSLRSNSRASSTLHRSRSSGSNSGGASSSSSAAPRSSKNRFKSQVSKLSRRG
ncbi:hypothetical protein BCV70DRAFT_38455 [Testicularia cyperi]|uniref:Uncharacterized protein n=1 Tax=Testicularia cyperi TaxID=1882483 RepID=A0A317XKQ4_9BASI|nr:hypothetical protein BCV70DRAFT_38455 [Testicularia cyperi]